VVVIAILGILAAIAVPKLGSSRKGAKIATHNANVRILKSIATMYIAEHPDAGSDELIEKNLKGYLDGDKYPDVPSGLEDLKDGANNKIEGPYEISLDSGNIIVKPGEYKDNDRQDE